MSKQSLHLQMLRRVALIWKVNGWASRPLIPRMGTQECARLISSTGYVLQLCLVSFYSSVFLASEALWKVSYYLISVNLYSWAGFTSLQQVLSATANPPFWKLMEQTWPKHDAIRSFLHRSFFWHFFLFLKIFTIITQCKGVTFLTGRQFGDQCMSKVCREICRALFCHSLLTFDCALSTHMQSSN